jgi:hypothetical protein
MNITMEVVEWFLRNFDGRVVGLLTESPMLFEISLCLEVIQALRSLRSCNLTTDSCFF